MPSSSIALFTVNSINPGKINDIRKVINDIKGSTIIKLF